VTTAKETAIPGNRLATSLYIAATMALGAAVPHAVIAFVGDWPGQLFMLHALTVLLLALGGWRAEHPPQLYRNYRKKKAKSQESEIDRLHKFIKLQRS